MATITVVYPQLDVDLEVYFSKIPTHTFCRKVLRSLCKSDLFLFNDYVHNIFFEEIFRTDIT